MRIGDRFSKVCTRPKTTNKEDCLDVISLWMMILHSLDVNLVDLLINEFVDILEERLKDVM